jgi:hypothetical protein
MPTYNSVCDECGAVHEYVRRIKDYLDTPDCCERPTRKIIISAPVGVVFGRFETFRSMVDGTLIRTARELKEHNKRNGVINLAEGWSEERVIKGDYGTRPKPDPKDIKEDVIQAVKMIEAGYTPRVEEYSDAPE